MLIKRKDCIKIVTAARSTLKDKKFNLQTQYKILKLVKAIEEEEEIMNQSVLKIANEYAEKDEIGNIIQNEDGGIKIDQNRNISMPLTVKVNIL